VRGIVNAAFDRALKLLKAQRSSLEAGALTLLQQETLEQKDLKQIQVTLPVAAASGGGGGG